MDWKGAEKRRFVRANFPCKIVIYTPQQHTITSHTENIGAGGVRVIINEKLDISSMVDLEVYLDRQPIFSRARVVWVVGIKSSLKDKSEAYDTGLEFYQIDEDSRKTIQKFVEAIISENISGESNGSGKD